MVSQDRVKEIFQDCLLKKDEIVRGKPCVDFTKIDPISKNFSGFQIAFSNARLGTYSTEINAMLDQLPESLHEGKGNGAPLVQACRNGAGLWTTKLGYAEELVMLGMGIKRVDFCLARNAHDSLLDEKPEEILIVIKKKEI